MGVKDGKFEYYVGSLEGWSPKKEYIYIYRGELPKKGGLDSLQIQGRGLGKKEGNALYVDY